MLYCIERGCCSGELGRDWVALRCDGPDDLEPPAIVVYCPPCAASEFVYRSDAADDYA